MVLTLNITISYSLISQAFFSSCLIHIIHKTDEPNINIYLEMLYIINSSCVIGIQSEHTSQFDVELNNNSINDEYNTDSINMNIKIILSILIMAGNF